MDEALNATFAFLNQGWVGVAVGAVGILFAVYQTLRRTRPAPCFQYISQGFIAPNAGTFSGKVEVYFDGNAVERLMLTHIVFWNDGPTPLRKEDVGGNAPISFSFDQNATILEAEIISVSRPANNLKVKVSEDLASAFVLFDFLDQNDGAMIKIWHTSAEPRPTCTATLIGVPKGVRPLGRMPLQNGLRQYRGIFPFLTRGRSQRAMGIAMTVIGLLGVGASFFIADAPTTTQSQVTGAQHGVRAVMAIFSAGYSAMGLLLLWVTRRRFPKGLHTED